MEIEQRLCPSLRFCYFCFWPVRSGAHLLGNAHKTALLMRLIKHFYSRFVSMENENNFLNYEAKLLTVHARKELKHLKKKKKTSKGILLTKLRGIYLSLSFFQKFTVRKLKS